MIACLTALFGFAPLLALPQGLHVPTETFMLPNGMSVVLHEDHSLPTVAINTWFAVGSKDEAPGRTGFAHLFEHLMFMGTARVPGNLFDVIMESGGGSNNASTSTDRTNYFSSGPSALLPTLLWLDADRLDALADDMTQEKLDAQRDVVRNERRQTTENVPYGKAELLLPELLYPAAHPYHHSVIGSHEDLEAATVEDVVAFFRTHYVPANASLVVAGDFDPEVARQLVERTFGAVPARPAPEHASVPPVHLEREKRMVTTDKVEFPKLYLVWHSPAHYAPGDAELDLTARILAGGPSSRLHERLVLETRLAQEVDAYQASQELGSLFQIEAVAAPGADLEELKREILAILAAYVAEGPTPGELERVQAQTEVDFLQGMESLLLRADRINAYRHFFGVSDGFQRDLERYTKATEEGVREVAAATFGEGRVDLRILPEGAQVAESALDERPADLPQRPYAPPAVETIRLSNGIALHAVPRPGTRLFSGTLIVHGGDALVAPEKAGVAALLASLLASGAGGLDAAAFAAAVDSLGAELDARAGVDATTVSVNGLTSRMEETLDRFADMVLLPNLSAEDFEREKALQEAAVAARKDEPRRLASTVADALTFGRDAALGRPVSGWEETVAGLTLGDVHTARARLLNPARASFVFVGDFRLDQLRAALEERFGQWSGAADAVVPASAARQAQAVLPPGSIALVERPDAPQTVIVLQRPVDTLEGVERVVREAANTVLGGSFTSRLNQNLREKNGFTYGAGSRLRTEGERTLLLASAAVFTEKTGAALVEFRRELERLAAEGIDQDELSKATETLRTRLIGRAETTAGLARSLAGLLLDGRPLDATARDLAALDEVTREAVGRLCGSGLFAWDELLIVLVGDPVAVRAQLAEAGFPAPTTVSPDGHVLGD